MSVTQGSDVDIEEVIDGLGRFIKGVVEPLERQHADLLADDRLLYDKAGTYSPEMRKLKTAVRTASADAGYYTLFASEELGGGGLGHMAHYLVWEYLFRVYGPARLLVLDCVGHWATGPSFLLRGLQPTARAAVVPRIMSGEVSTCFAMSEPDAGSDVRSMRSNAVRDGGEWVLNGIKQWITNSPLADYAIVFAVTDRVAVKEGRRGISAFLVPTDSPGFAFDSVIHLFGRIGGNEGIISLTDVRVPDTFRIGDLDEGLQVGLGGLAQGRMYNAGRAVGLAQWALGKARDYAKERIVFGSPIAGYQAIQFMLAESAMDIYQSRAVSLDLARRLDAGEDCVTELNMVKAITTEMSFTVVDRAMQVHGGMGMTTEMGLFQAFHMTRISRVSDGTSEIMRRSVARSVLDKEWLQGRTMTGMVPIGTSEFR